MPGSVLLPDVKFQRVYAYAQGEAQAQRQRLPGVLDAMRAQANRRPDNHLFVGVGYTSSIVLGVLLAGMQTGTIKRFVGVEYDRGNSLGEWLGRAVRAFADAYDVKARFIHANAILDEERIPGEIDAAIDELRTDKGGAKGSVSLVESIAFGTPGPIGGEALNLLHLAADGQLRRVAVKPALEKQQVSTRQYMGTNPGLWWRLLVERGLTDAHSIGLSFSSATDMQVYENLRRAKEALEQEAIERVRKHGDSQGRRRVALYPATVTPALEKIPRGLIAGILSAYARGMKGDNLTAAEQGALTFHAALDDSFVHPQLVREGGGALLRWDGVELAMRPGIDETLKSLEAAVPPDFNGTMSRADAFSLFRKVMGWQPAYVDHVLRPLQILLGVEEMPPDAPPTPAGPVEGAGGGEESRFGSALIEEGQRPAEGAAPFAVSPPTPPAAPAPVTDPAPAIPPPAAPADDAVADYEAIEEEQRRGPATGQGSGEKK